MDTGREDRQAPAKRGAVLVGIICILTALLFSCSDSSRATPQIPTTEAANRAIQRVVINGLKFDMELALTRNERTQGLSDRASIAENGGMLFVFPKNESVGFVMRRCLVPIDIAFVTEDGTVVAMYEMKVEPYDTDDGDLTSYPSHQPVRFALEFKGGTLTRLGLQRGDKVDLPYADLKARAK